MRRIFGLPCLMANGRRNAWRPAGRRLAGLRRRGGALPGRWAALRAGRAVARALAISCERMNTFPVLVIYE